MTPRLRRKDVPAYLADKHGIPIALATLNKLATIGGGPVIDYFGKVPLYHISELDKWAEAKLSRVASTSERVRTGREVLRTPEGREATAGREIDRR